MNNETIYYAGIDAGGTKTECAIVDENGECLGVGRGGPSRETYVGMARTLQSLEEAITAAVEQSGVTSVQLTGCTHKLARHKEVSDLVLKLLGSELRDYSEGEAALGCIDVFRRFGISHIAGTGTCTWCFPGDGSEIRAGGWGMLLGDEGGGYDIAVKGLRAAVRAIDGRGSTTVLTQLMCCHFELVQERQSIIDYFVSEHRRHIIASFAPCVSFAAMEQDVVASEIMNYAAFENANSILTVARKAFVPSDAFPVALHGGVMNDHHIVASIIEQVNAEYPGADIRTPVHSPAVGLAMFIARGSDE